MKRLLTIITALLLTACAAGGPTPQSSVAAMETALAAADTGALLYVSLPLCPAAPVCADRGVLQNMNKAREAAFLAVMDADVVVNNPRFDQSAYNAAMVAAAGALDAFQKIVATVNR